MEIEHTIKAGTHTGSTAGWIGARRWIAALALLLAAFLPAPSIARTDVLVVRAEQSSAVEEVLSTLRVTLADGHASQFSLRIVTTAEFSQTALRTSDRNFPDLIVTLGTDAAAAVVRKKLPAPIYYPVCRH